MNKEREGDTKIAVGYFLIWIFSLIGCSAPKNDFRWWYSFPFVILFAIGGVLTASVIKKLIAYIFGAKFDDVGFSHEMIVIFWPLLLFLGLLASFFVMMGRLAR